jgi:hypothetical protein
MSKSYLLLDGHTFTPIDDDVKVVLWDDAMSPPKSAQDLIQRSFHTLDLSSFVNSGSTTGEGNIPRRNQQSSQRRQLQNA